MKNSDLSAICLLCVILVAPIAFISCGQKVSPLAEKGVIDLRGWNFKNNPVQLSGEWEFYWEKFLPVSNFDMSRTYQEKEFITVPGTWRCLLNGIKKFPGTGFATYRLKILTDAGHNDLAIRMLTASTACNLYINGKKTASAGKPGTDKESTIPSYNPGVNSFTNTGAEIDLVIHISNYHYRDGGLWRPLWLGFKDELLKEKEKSDYFAIFIFGAMIIMSLYHFGLFSLRKKDIYFLYFSILCLLVAVRTLCNGEFLIVHISPFLTFRSIILCEYLSLYIAASIFALYINSLFPGESSKVVTGIVVFISSIYSLSAVILPTVLFTRMIVSFEVIGIIFFLYIVYVVVKSMIKKRKGAAIFLTGMAVILFALINDLLHSNFIIQTMNLFNLAIFIFICIHSFILSMLYTHSFNMVEKLSLDLQQLNNLLETKVVERTEELQTAYDNIKELTVTDPLTKCFNRRYLNEKLPSEIERAVRQKMPLSVIICDIDRFKEINDKFGHLSGDSILMEFPGFINKNIRLNTDWVVRFGGEEFIIVLPKTDLGKACIIAERIRRSIESSTVSFNGIDIHVTASFGVAVLGDPYNLCSVEELINLADSMLYEAKKNGRNKVAG